jgi:Pyridoxamine 5'-phosphate oxidase
MVAASQQRRGRAIAMTPAELDDFLTEMRTCRVATMGPGGPHVAPLWFLWSEGALWLSSVVRSQRWADLRRDPRVAVVVDAGEQYHELRGAEIKGTAEPVGEVPRSGSPDALVAGPELLFARKYSGGDSMWHDGRHGWLRVTPVKITSWDFRKLPPELRRLGR